MTRLKQLTLQSYKRNHNAVTMWIGPIFFVVLSDADQATVVLKSTQHKNFLYKYAQYVIGKGSVFAPVDIWQRRRKIIAPTFTTRLVTKFVPVFEAQNKTLVEKLKSKVGKGNFSCWDYITSYSLDSVCETVFGLNLELQHQPDHPFFKSFVKIFENVAARLLQPWLQSDAIYKLMPVYARQEHMKKIIHEFIDDLSSDAFAGRKRPRVGLGIFDSGSDTETEGRVTAKCNSARRGKPTSKGRGTALTRAKAERKIKAAEAREEAFKRSLRSQALRKNAPEVVLDSDESSSLDVRTEDPIKLGAEELRAEASRNASLILEVAQKSGNLKSGFINKLKDSAASLQSMVDALASRTEAEETLRLRADNSRLRKEIDDLKTELKAHRPVHTSNKRNFKTFLELIIENSKNSDTAYTLEELREETLVLLLAGTDTSAVGICTTILMLSQHTDLQERVYKEIQEVIGDSDKPLQLEDLDKLKYLKAVINETLRLYPPVPFILRYCKDDIKLPSGLNLPEGSNVIISIWGIHRNPEHWGEDANDFNPDRFMSGKIPNAFMPFSIGPRNCTGLKFAMLSITTSLVALLRQYRFNPATNFKYDKNNPLRFSFDIMMKHVDGFTVQVENRNKM
ncbi:cytochrome P450 4C1-like [Nymphalis io]|uniref:cytochrome P450 4C1-like n=1 Tax=Inachis io TaxID=171585 RepID=UPI0021692682|nr:cytochrome P450 4C1-like [Nymphalis io]